MLHRRRTHIARTADAAIGIPSGADGFAADQGGESISAGSAGVEASCA